MRRTWAAGIVVVLMRAGVAATAWAEPDGERALQQMVRDMSRYQKTMLWDGDQYPATPKTWTEPAGACWATVTNGPAHSGARALHAHAEGQGWMGVGLNLAGWWPADRTWDIAPFRNVSFWVKLTVPTNAPPLKPTVQLVSAPARKSATVELERYAPGLADGNWHEAVIPLEDLKGGEFDPAAFWELDIGVWLAAPGAFDLYLDEVGPDNREPAAP